MKYHFAVCKMQRITAGKVKLEEGNLHVPRLALIQFHLVCLHITTLPL